MRRRGGGSSAPPGHTFLIGRAGRADIRIDTADLDTVRKVSAASGTEIYALREGSGAVVRFNAATKKFENPIPPPANKTIADLEATSAGRLWAVTTDNKIYAYAPPR